MRLAAAASPGPWAVRAEAVQLLARVAASVAQADPAAELLDSVDREPERLGLAGLAARREVPAGRTLPSAVAEVVVRGAAWAWAWAVVRAAVPMGSS